MWLRLTNLLGALLFWVFVVVDVYAACYWVASKIAGVLTAVDWLKAEAALAFSLIMGALMTLGVLIGLLSLVKRKSRFFLC